MNRCVNKALARGVEAALEDLPRSGRPREISDEAIAWVIGVACTKPVELGYASELWTYTKLVQHISQHAPEAGYPETAAIFFSKMTRSFLRGIRVHSLAELQARIEQYLEEVNAEPVVFRWKYQIQEAQV